MIRQGHSYHRLFYHMVFTTKKRIEVFRTPGDEAEIFGTMKTKAESLDAYIEEAGGWLDHVHLLVRCSPKIALSKLYGQLKGFSARAWNIKHPDQTLAWSDGVFVATVDPDHSEQLRGYIRHQRQHHEQKTQVERWEPSEE